MNTRIYYVNTKTCFGREWKEVQFIYPDIWAKYGWDVQPDYRYHAMKTYNRCYNTDLTKEDFLTPTEYRNIGFEIENDIQKKC